tara:strand:+ start:367 stop:582 length:216 start_codon:yes stop_codon:yes gene_type:complete
MGYGKKDRASSDLNKHIKKCMDYAKSRILAQRPKSSKDVAGIGEAESKNRGLLSQQPSKSRTVKGMPDKLK